MKFLNLCGVGIVHMLWIVPLYALVNFAVRPDVFKSVVNKLKGRLEHE